MKDKNEIDSIVNIIKRLPITKKLYELKSKGKIPKIIVQVSKNGEVKVARLKISEVEFYFHNTKMNGKKVDVTKREAEVGNGEKITIYELPFDGWEFNNED